MKGRRFNIVDVLIVLLVVVAVVYIAKRVLKPTAAAANIPVTLTFQSAPTEYYSRDLSILAHHKNIEAASGGTFYPVGTLQSARAVPLYVSVPLPNGSLRKAVDPLSRLVLLKISAVAQAQNGDYLFHNNPLYIGESLVLKAGPLELAGTVVDIARHTATASAKAHGVEPAAAGPVSKPRLAGESHGHR